MDIERAKRRSVERRLRQDQAIGGDYQRLHSRRAQRLDCRRRLQRLGLEDFDAVLDGKALDRACRSLHATARCAIGLRQDQRDAVSGLEQAR